MSDDGYVDLVRGLASTDDGAFAEYVSGLALPAHLREVQRFARRHPRGVILMPRGHGKTTWAVHHVARRIGETQGRIKVGIATAAETDALKRSRAVRTLVEDRRFAEVFGWAAGGVASRKWSEGEWTVAGAEGYAEKDATVRAGSLWGLKPGPRFELLVADDLIGPDECTTAPQRQKSADRFWSVIVPMVVPGGRIIVLGTRWHGDDLYAELAAKCWPVHLRQALGPDGLALWPGYWSAERLAAERDQMGTAIFDLQYQNDPTGMGGNVFRRGWFRHVDAVPAGGRRVGIDLAASTRERADYTAAVEVVEDREGNLIVTGAWRARLDGGHRAWVTGLDDAGSPTRTEGPRLVASYRPLEAVNIEATAYQSTFTQEMLRHTRLPARAVHPDTDKVTRARALAARYEGGKVFHLRGGPGIADLEAELAGFPNAEHDDLVDALVYAADLGRVEFSFA